MRVRAGAEHVFGPQLEKMGHGAALGLGWEGKTSTNWAELSVHAVHCIFLSFIYRLVYTLYMKFFAKKFGIPSNTGGPALGSKQPSPGFWFFISVFCKIIELVPASALFKEEPVHTYYNKKRLGHPKSST